MKNIIILLLFPFTFYAYSQQFSNNQLDSINELDSINGLVIKKIEKSISNEAQNLIDSARLFDKNNKNKLRIDLWQAKLFIKNGNDEKALRLLLDGFTELEANNKSSLYVNYAKEIGQILGRSKNFKRALKYFNLALQSAVSRKDSLEISSINFNFGSTFQMQNNLDSAAYFYEKVIRFHPKSSTKNEILATTYGNLMSLAIRDNNLDLAEEYGKESLSIHIFKKDTIKIAGSLNNLGGIYMYKNDLDNSNKYSFKALEMLSARDEMKAREIKFYAMDNISQVYFLQGKYKEAYNYLFEATEIRHGITSEKLNSKVTEIEAKYDFAIEQEKRKELEYHHQNMEFWLIVLVLASLILLVLSWFIYKNAKFKRKNLKLEYVQEKMIDERRINKIKNETQEKILNATIEAKEFERKYIAEILHDSVSTLLSSANMHLYAVKSAFKGEKIPNEIIKAEGIISEASDKIRNLSHKLISPVLLKFGLKVAIEDLCEKHSNSQLVFSCNSGKISRYDYDFEIKIHSIIEELVNNILKHSNAREAFIKLEEKEKNLQINIMDNGKGFDISKIHKKDGLGLRQIASRIKIMKGEFNVKSSKKNGTHIFMRVPIPNKK